MRILTFCNDPEISAKMLDDKTLKRQCKEVAQLLSNAIHRDYRREYEAIKDKDFILYPKIYKDPLLVNWANRHMNYITKHLMYLINECELRFGYISKPVAILDTWYEICSSKNFKIPTDENYTPATHTKAMAKLYDTTEKLYDAFIGKPDDFPDSLDWNYVKYYSTLQNEFSIDDIIERYYSLRVPF